MLPAGNNLFIFLDMAKRNKTKQSVTKEVLKALIPYTEQNIKLVFKPNLFFNDLERLTRSNRATLANTLTRSKRVGYVEMKNGIPTLTSLGRAKIGHIDKPELLSGWLIVSFDIPESRRRDRYELRTYLRRRGFKQVQQSLWVTKYDYAEDIKEVVAELHLGSHVMTFIAASVFAPSLLES